VPGKESKGPVSTYTLGISHRRRNITIGGNRKKVDIYVKGLKPVEFYVVREGDAVNLLMLKREYGKQPSVILSTMYYQY
jgi:hypothetical protein